MDMIKSADYVIDIGPEGGSGGGKIVAEGRPEEIIKNSKSLTGHFLKMELNPLNAYYFFRSPNYQFSSCLQFSFLGRSF